MERETELARLAALLAAAERLAGGAVLVEGPAGIGKTRLLEAVRTSAAERGFRVLTATGSDLEQDYPYGLVRQLFEPVLPAEPESLAGMAEMARPVFAAPRSENESTASHDRSEAVMYGLYRLAANLASRGPVLLTIDDAHWADSHSLVFLNYLGRRLASLRIALTVASRRRGDSGELLGRLAAVAEPVPVGPLSAGGTAELVRALVSGTASDELCDVCHAASGGNPFLVRELAASLRDEDLGPDALDRLEGLVPDAVRRHVLVRLSRTGHDAVELARAVAVLGRGDLRDAANLAELDGAAAARAFDALVEADVLTPGLPLQFIHPLIREAVYLDASTPFREQAHARAARLLATGQHSPERVAVQLLACEPAASEWAVGALRAAASEALVRGAPHASARYLARALAEPPPGDLLGTVLRELGVAEVRAGLPEARGHLANALELTHDPLDRASIAQELAALYNWIGRFEEAAALLDAAISGLEEQHQEVRLSLEAEAAVVAVTVLDARRRLAPRMRALRAQASLLADQPAAAPVLALLATDLAESDGRADEAVALAERAFVDGRLFGRSGPMLAIGASALISADRLVQADVILSAAIREGESRGALQQLRDAYATRARARLRSGRTAEAESDARHTLDLSTLEEPLRPHGLGQLIDALIEQGRLEEAESLVAAEELALHDPASILYQPLRASKARLLWTRGRPAEALELFEEQGRWAEAWGCRNAGWISWRANAALLHSALGRSDRALELAEQDLEAARAFGAPRPLAIALRTVGLIDAQRGPSLLSDSVDVLEHEEPRPQLARSLVELGAALRRAGERRAARPPLRRALDLADDCGLVLLAQHARDELAASGARLRQSHTTGAAALTPSERRVANLAAEGLANREIAQQLFLSPKTVEMHLGHTYRKLGIHSRAELASVLANAV